VAAGHAVFSDIKIRDLKITSEYCAPKPGEIAVLHY
jgi:hypothetical protein